MFIDTHAHLNFNAFKDDLNQPRPPRFAGDAGGTIKNAKEAGVLDIINVGSNYLTSVKAVEITEKGDKRFKGDKGDKRFKGAKGVRMFAAVGLHPIHLSSDITETEIIGGKEYKFTTKKEEFDYKKFADLISENRDIIVGVGETGLDFYRLGDKNNFQSNSNDQIIKLQKQVFYEHIKLAREFDLPMILHCRGSEDNPYGAYNEMLEILKYECYSRAGSPSQHRESIMDPRVKPEDDNLLWGVIHCFAGTEKQAKEFIDLGFLIGVNGIATFKKSVQLQNIIREIPLEKIVLETDSPYLSPRLPSLHSGIAGVADPYRGKRNEPANIPIIARKIAELKKLSTEEIEIQTTKNAQELFSLN